MTKRMLIDATHPEEIRVAVVDGNQLEEFDVESASRKQLKGNIYLAKVTRVEPSLQAAFVDYGGNRHGFLAFNEIHPDYYQIPVADRERLLAEQAAEDEEAEAAEEAAEEAAAAAAAAGEALPAAMPDAPELSFEPVEEPDEPPEEEPEEHRETETEPPHEDAAPVEEPVPFEAAVEPLAEGEAEHHAVEGDEADDDEAPAVENEIETVEAAPTDAKPIETIGGDELEEHAERQRQRNNQRRALRRYKIQEVIKRRQILLVQVVKEERGNKGAALTTYLSLAGRYCVLMPNTGKGGGISRKIGGGSDRKRLKSIISDLDPPPGMAVIVRTAGADRSAPEIKRDYDYLLRLWADIRGKTLESTAPALIHEEANIIMRAVRDHYSRDVDEVIVEGEEGYRMAKDLMKMLIPSHAKKVQSYEDENNVPLFSRYQIETQLESMNHPTVQLRSGGYIVMNSTEALVAIDVNSGRATRGRNIEETALKTNLEAATEIARQLRLRDLAGLIVIDFIDMDHHRNQIAVERRLKEAMRHDRARIQIGRISPFGLLELSRQRLRPSLVETVTDVCEHCGGTGIRRSTESTALHVLRGIEEEAQRKRAREIMVAMPTSVALYLLNHKRNHLNEIESRFGLNVQIKDDDSLIPPKYVIERTQPLRGDERDEQQARRGNGQERGDSRRDSVREETAADHEHDDDEELEAEGEHRPDQDRERGSGEEGGGRRRRRRRGRGRGGNGQDRGDNRREDRPHDDRPAAFDGDAPQPELSGEDEDADEGDLDYSHEHEEVQPREQRGEGQRDDGREGGRRRRGRRGGRNRNRSRERREGDQQPRSDLAFQSEANYAGNEAVGGEFEAEDGENAGTPFPGVADEANAEGGEPRRRRVRRRRGRRPESEGAEMLLNPQDDIAAEEADASEMDDADDQPSVEIHGEQVPVESVTVSATTTIEPTPEPKREPARQPEPEEPAGPPRRGWWQRLVQ